MAGVRRLTVHQAKGQNLVSCVPFATGTQNGIKTPPGPDRLRVIGLRNVCVLVVIATRVASHEVVGLQVVLCFVGVFWLRRRWFSQHEVAQGVEKHVPHPCRHGVDIWVGKMILEDDTSRNQSETNLAEVKCVINKKGVEQP